MTCTLAVLLCLVPCAGPAADEKTQPQFSEAQIKAAILVGFARTTEWPAGTFKDGRKDFVIGILGRDTLGEEATAVFTNPEASKAHTVRFKVITDQAEARGCHVLFIPRTERRRTREIIERLRSAPVLTVGESEEFLDQNGIVNLVPRSGAMKFEVNLFAARAANLRIPAKVLGSALKVRGKYE